MLSLSTDLTVPSKKVMQVWAGLGLPERAEAVLEELLSRSNRKPGEETPLAPNSESFALVIRGWLDITNKGSKEALVTAVRWLDSLRERQKKDSGVFSQVDLYSRILAACRTCAPMYPDILDLAVITFDNLRESHHAVECIHYSRLLQVGLFALSRPENNEIRTSFVRQIVQDCCEDGLVSKPLLGRPTMMAGRFARVSAWCQS